MDRKEELEHLIKLIRVKICDNACSLKYHNKDDNFCSYISEFMSTFECFKKNITVLENYTKEYNSFCSI